ncbi:hypothetical protein ACSQ67_014152 [Phaseolus vulgaris]
MPCSSLPPLFFFIFFVFLLPLVLSLPSFPSDNLTLYGDAFFSHKAITLTTHQPSCSSSSIGRAFFIYPLRFLDPQTNSTASFSSRFSFSILSSPSCPSGDGLAFLIASSTHFPALSMGLPQPSPSSSSFFAVEFDTTFDPSLGDINDNHVALDVNSASSFASVDALSRGIDLKSGKLITAWVEYRHAIKMVRVWLAYSSTRPPTPILASKIDLSERLEDFMHVGFTASNGEGSSDYLIHHWQFTTLDHDSRSMDVVDEGDCFLCYEGDSTGFGYDSNARENERRKKIAEMALGLAGLTAFVVSVMAAMVVVCVFLTRRKGGVRKNREQGQSCRFQTSKVPTRLSLSEIKSATMGFNRDRLVGEGASAKVYKGYLPFGGDVAVKRFERENDLDCLHNPFATEFATMVVYEHSSSTREATIPAGTMGYLAPEYVYSGVPTVKTDVYSFGVVVLEVASGRKPVEDDGTVVVDYVWSLWERRKLIEAADPRLMGKFDALDMERMLLVGLLCVHPDDHKRPRVREAARILKKEAPLPLLPPTKPRVRIRPISPHATPETPYVVADSFTTDEAPYLTPRRKADSQFSATLLSHIKTILLSQPNPTLALLQHQRIVIKMETVCLKCGDRGFQVALVFCSGCKAYALHRYCLKGPVIFTDAVTWFCDDCAKRFRIPPSLDQSTPLSSVTRNYKNLEKNVTQSTRVVANCKERVKKLNKLQKEKIKKKHKEGKVNYETKGVLSSSPELEHPQCIISSEEECEVTNECGAAPRDVANTDLGLQTVPFSQGATNNDSSCVELHDRVYAQPLIDPIWRGSIYFCNETIGTVSGLLAHVSDLACSKVAQETGRFPEVLHAELVPKSIVWPESFKRKEPTDQDIALFFFPDSEGTEKVFDALVDDVICQEHAIRFVAKNTELLVFPSTELPIAYWRFEAKYYLWGVFKRKQTSEQRNNGACRD